MENVTWSTYYNHPAYITEYTVPALSGHFANIFHNKARQPLFTCGRRLIKSRLSSDALICDISARFGGLARPFLKYVHTVTVIHRSAANSQGARPPVAGNTRRALRGRCPASFYSETYSRSNHFEGLSRPLEAWGMAVEGAAKAYSQREVGSQV
jgi:hypothetical protein